MSYLRSNSYKAVCQRCGFIFPSSFLQRERDTFLYVCGRRGNNCLNPVDKITEPFKVRRSKIVRDVGLQMDIPFHCYSDAIAGIAVAGCTLAGTVQAPMRLSNG